MQLKAERDFMLCGDVNIAHQEIDLKNWKSNQKNSGFLPEERAWMTKLLDEAGLVDVYRTLQPDSTDAAYTWWSNRGQAYAKNVGWRLDYHLATPGMAATARREAIYKDAEVLRPRAADDRLRLQAVAGGKAMPWADHPATHGGVVVLAVPQRPRQPGQRGTVRGAASGVERPAFGGRRVIEPAPARAAKPALRRQAHHALAVGAGQAQRQLLPSAHHHRVTPGVFERGAHLGTVGRPADGQAAREHRVHEQEVTLACIGGGISAPRSAMRRA